MRTRVFALIFFLSTAAFADRVDDLEQFLVEAEFFFGQVYFGEQEAFGEQVVGYGDVLEHILRLQQFFQLLVAFGHEK